MFFRRFLNIFRTLASLGFPSASGLYAWAARWQVAYQGCSKTGRDRKIITFKGKNTIFNEHPVHQCIHMHVCTRYILDCYSGKKPIGFIQQYWEKVKPCDRRFKMISISLHNAYSFSQSFKKITYVYMSKTNDML